MEAYRREEKVAELVVKGFAFGAEEAKWEKENDDYGYEEGIE